MGSNKWVVVVSVLGILLTFGVIGLTITNLVGGTPGFLGGAGGEVVTRDYDLEGFTAIGIHGGWAVEISGDDDYAVTVEAAEGFIDQVQMSVSGDELVLDVDGPFRFNRTLRARISVPELNRVHVEGGADIEISDLNLDELEISSDGAANLDAEDLLVRNLVLRVAGAANMDLRDAAIENAELNLEGAVNVDINMTGGSLTGSLEGLGNVEYFGEVSEQRVSVEGLGKVERGD